MEPQSGFREEKLPSPAVFAEGRLAHAPGTEVSPV